METSVVVGDRVSTVSGPGTVRFAGSTSFAQGKWIGVELDGKNGKHNGTVQGKSYFSCRDGYGIFVRPAAIKILEGARRVSVDEAGKGKVGYSRNVIDVDGASGFTKVVDAEFEIGISF
jgi:dynactin complex subunit